MNDCTVCPVGKTNNISFYNSALSKPWAWAEKWNLWREFQFFNYELISTHCIEVLLAFSPLYFCELNALNFWVDAGAGGGWLEDFPWLLLLWWPPPWYSLVPRICWCFVYDHWREASLRDVSRKRGALQPHSEKATFTQPAEKHSIVIFFFPLFHTNWDLSSVEDINDLG